MWTAIKWIVAVPLFVIGIRWLYEPLWTIGKTAQTQTDDRFREVRGGLLGVGIGSILFFAIIGAGALAISIYLISG